MQAQDKSRVGPTALHILNLGARWRLVVKATPRLLHLREAAPLHIVWEAGWAPASFWTCAEKGISLACTGVRTPILPAHSDSLYKKCYKLH